MAKKFFSQEKAAEYYNSISKKENHIPQTETLSKECQAEEVRARLQSLSESYGKSRNQQSPLCRQYLTGIAQLSKIFAMLQNEEEAHQDGQPISLPHVSMEVEQYISECLKGLLSGSLGTSQIPSLLRTYGVVTPLPDGKSSVSLFRIHLILQDSFQGSLLCGLFDMMLGCRLDVESKALYY